jgi:hypothetical protein
VLGRGGTAGITAWEEGVRYRGLCFAYSERSGWPASLKDVKLWVRLGGQDDTTAASRVSNGVKKRTFAQGIANLCSPLW